MKGNFTSLRLVAAVAIAFSAHALAETGSYQPPSYCLPPAPPFIPNDSELRAEYQELLRQDYESYLIGVTHYTICLDSERARIITEARQVGEEYRDFLHDNVTSR